MCRPPENPANIRKHTARRSVPATFVGCVQMRFLGSETRREFRQVQIAESLDDFRHETKSSPPISKLYRALA